MASFAPVCPIHILQGLACQGNYVLGDYHLPLAHDVLKHPDEYRRMFDTIIEDATTDDGCYATVILDNSVIELGTAVNIDVIAEAAKIVSANVIVLPDILLDCDATIVACKQAIKTWTPILQRELDWDWSYMFVPQGRTLAEFVQCAEAFRDDDLIGWWGVPRNFNIHGLGSRTTAVNILEAIQGKRNIHLLGFSDNVLDDILSARHPAVNGIDSAVPIRAASLGLPMSLTFDKSLPPRGDWWDDPETKFVPLMANNVMVTRDMVE